MSGLVSKEVAYPVERFRKQKMIQPQPTLSQVMEVSGVNEHRKRKPIMNLNLNSPNIMQLMQKYSSRGAPSLSKGFQTERVQVTLDESNHLVKNLQAKSVSPINKLQSIGVGVPR